MFSKKTPEVIGVMANGYINIQLNQKVGQNTRLNNKKLFSSNLRATQSELYKASIEPHNKSVFSIEANIGTQEAKEVEVVNEFALEYSLAKKDLHTLLSTNSQNVQTLQQIFQSLDVSKETSVDKLHEYLALVQTLTEMIKASFASMVDKLDQVTDQQESQLQEELKTLSQKSGFATLLTYYGLKPIGVDPHKISACIS